MTDAAAPFTTTERLIRAISRQVNTRPALKRASHAYLRSAGASGVHAGTRRLLHITNAEVLDTLPPDRGVIVASNHRSLCDLYVVSSVLLRRCAWIERLYFPVRTEHIYDRWGGLLLNALLSGVSMYPPIYRDAARRTLNRDAVSFVVDELRRPGTVVGLHPEGRRSVSDDPYTLLPAQPGLGEIVQRARPLVLPVFILGLAADLVKQMRTTLNRTAAPITITFGTPMNLDGYGDAVPGPRHSLRIAQAVRAEIEALGAIDRQVRARLTR
ncbi:MAG: phospholipid/glycerol acyltransferase [Acidobacteria bacterium]|nr:phospholipid/glycerol acyltransferase [Acidobacteriota bacterium]